MNFSQKFLELRKKSGLSQEEVADKLGVSRQAISRWETGSALPDALNIVGICQVFGVTADYLINDDGVQVNAKKEEKQIDKSLLHVRPRYYYVCIVAHVFAMLVQLIGVICFICSQVVAMWVLFCMGLFISIGAICAHQITMSDKPCNVRSVQTKAYFRVSVWLFAFFPILVAVMTIFYFIIMSTNPGGSTMPVIALTLLSVLLYVLICMIVYYSLRDKQ